MLYLGANITFCISPHLLPDVGEISMYSLHMPNKCARAVTERQRVEAIYLEMVSLIKITQLQEHIFAIRVWGIGGKTMEW